MIVALHVLPVVEHDEPESDTVSCSVETSVSDVIPAGGTFVPDDTKYQHYFLFTNILVGIRRCRSTVGYNNKSCDRPSFSGLSSRLTDRATFGQMEMKMSIVLNRLMSS